MTNKYNFRFGSHSVPYVSNRVSETSVGNARIIGRASGAADVRVRSCGSVYIRTRNLTEISDNVGKAVRSEDLWQVSSVHCTLNRNRTRVNRHLVQRHIVCANITNYPAASLTHQYLWFPPEMAGYIFTVNKLSLKLASIF